MSPANQRQLYQGLVNTKDLQTPSLQSVFYPYSKSFIFWRGFEEKVYWMVQTLLTEGKTNQLFASFLPKKLTNERKIIPETFRF